ncbi:hypothetical protein QUF75_01915 [Desulfococcaceae bacterium HSG7]|nr:hypothetical protein [Desulfococcaceae bacterium HSG7]
MSELRTPISIPEGLDVIIERLKQRDVELYARFQEDEWGCRYLGEGRFEFRSRNYMENRNEKEELNEMGVSWLLSRYSVERLQKRLIAKRTTS